MNTMSSIAAIKFYGARSIWARAGCSGTVSSIFMEKGDQNPTDFRFLRLEFVIKMMSYNDGEHIKLCVCSPCYRLPRREAIWIIGSRFLSETSILTPYFAKVASGVFSCKMCHVLFINSRFFIDFRRIRRPMGPAFRDLFRSFDPLIP